MKHTPTPWSLTMAQDGEYTGPGDNPPGYAGDWYETGEIVTGHGIPQYIAFATRINDAKFVVLACNHHEKAIEMICRFVDFMDNRSLDFPLSQSERILMGEAIDLLACMRGEIARDRQDAKETRS